MADSDPMGLQGAYGAAGGANALQQLLARRFAQQQYADLQKQRDFQNQLELRKLEQADELKRLQLTQGAEQKDQTAFDTLITQGAFKPGQQVSPQTVGRAQRVGVGDLFPEQQSLPSQQTTGFLRMGPTGPAGGQLSTTSSAPQGTGRFIFAGTGKQADTTAERERKIAADQAKVTDAQAKLEESQRNHDLLNAVAEGRLSVEQLRAQIAQMIANTKATTVNLSPEGKRAKAAIEQAGPMTDRVLKMIRTQAPDIETNPAKYNTPMGKLESLYQTGKYKAGFYDENDPRIQLISLLQPVQAGQYLRGSRSRQMLELALKHMADPTQTLLTQYQRAKELKSIMPEMLQGIVRAEQPVDVTNPLGGSYFDPNKESGAGGQEFDYVPGKGLVPRAK